MWGFPVFSVFSVFSFFSRFFRFVSKQFVSVVSLLYRNREFWLNWNKQKTHPNSLKESIFRVVSVCFGLSQNRSVCFGCFDIGSKHRNKPKFFIFGFTKQTRNRSCFGLFRFKPKFIFVCFEDTLPGGNRLPFSTAPKVIWALLSNWQRVIFLQAYLQEKLTNT